MQLIALVILGMGCLMAVVLAWLIIKNKGGGGGPSTGGPSTGPEPTSEPGTGGPGGDGGSGTLAGTDGYVNQSGLRLLGIPGRIQFDQNNGYCGELSLQMIMLKHGVWIPQSAARSASGGEMLLGVNYDRGCNNLGVKFVSFNGNNYKSFVTFAKQHLLQDRGVVQAVQLSGSSDKEYAHIIPAVGIKYSNASGYDGNDTLYVNTDYSTKAVQRKVSGYSSSNGQKGVEQGGSIPSNTKWGVAVIGPKYMGIGPPVEIYGLSRSREPGLGSSGSTSATLRVRKLTSGKKYNIYKYTNSGSVPNSSNAKPNGTPWKSFTASGNTYTANVSLPSNQLGYYVCVAA